jgi:hypothetical protein
VTEPINLELKLTNVSTGTYYVSGDLSLGVGGIGHEFGKYQLQFRKEGTTDFSVDREIIADGRPLRDVSAADFIVANKMILLRPGMFVGRTILSNWKGFTLREPGRYSIRAIYTSSNPPRDIPGLPFPIFLSPLVSNVIDLQVEP